MLRLIPSSSISESEILDRAYGFAGEGAVRAFVHNQEFGMAVLNKHKHGIPAGAVYIGRGSMWGNPYVIGRDGDRDAVCEKHRAYLKDQIQAGKITLEQLAELHGKDLVCFCAPLRCHGHTLERAAAWAVNQLNQQ